LEAWELLQDKDILNAACRHVDFLMSEVGPGKTDIVQTGMLYGLPSTSILKPVVLLYRATNNAKYLELAEYIVEQWAQHPAGIPDIINKGLTGTPVHTWFDDPWSWAKGYELISCVEGLLELYRVTGTSSYLEAAQNIHAAILGWERSPVGSVSFSDHFMGSRFLINTISEICDVIYWNRLSFELFLLTKDVKYMDEIERALYNALPCGMKPDGSWGLRRLRMTHEHIPAHFHFLPHHQCCVDNLPRGLFQAVESAVFMDEDGVCITLYNEGKGFVTLPSGGKVELAIEGDLLDDGKVHIRILTGSPQAFVLKLRMPAWSPKTEIIMNGEPVTAAEGKTWVPLKKMWEKGDTISIVFDIRVRVEYFDPKKIRADAPVIAWHETTWASMGFVSEMNIERWVNQKTGLTSEDALPHQKAAIFFRGPLALSRDIRFGDGDIFEPLQLNTDDNDIGVLVSIAAPDGIQKAYELTMSNGKIIKLCDFASAGNTWDSTSKFSAWQMVE